MIETLIAIRSEIIAIYERRIRVRIDVKFPFKLAQPDFFKEKQRGEQLQLVPFQCRLWRVNSKMQRADSDEGGNACYVIKLLAHMFVPLERAREEGD